jgi:hypothetical protein
MLVAANTGGSYAFVQSRPFNQGFGPTLVLPGLLAAPNVTDVDADGHPDIVYIAGFASGVAVYRNQGGTFEPARAIPLGRTVRSAVSANLNGDGARDLVALVTSTDRKVMVVPGLGFPDVDVNANGVADCEEELACGNCADDDGDGAIDAVDSDCPAGTLTLKQVTVRPARGAKPARAKIVAEVATAVDPSASSLGITVGEGTAYCGAPGLRARGRRAFRLAGAEGPLTKLVVQSLSRNRGLRVRASLTGLPAVNAGDVMQVWLGAAGEVFRGQGVLREKGKKVVAP